ncbi:cytochrome P450 [Streptomyces sp. NBC_00648]|uniref:cytochrome P450 n=1 Tax=Streptomyces sp. NBC_00648 TaxID=2975797 RepID=UPI0032513792
MTAMPHARNSSRLAGAISLQLFSKNSGSDRYALSAELRKLSPVFVSPLGTVVLSRYQDCLELLKSQDFEVESAEWRDASRPGWREYAGISDFYQCMLFRDPPDHTRLRRLISGAFTRRRVEELRPSVEAQVARALDTIARLGEDGSAVDLYPELTFPLPIAVIADLLGVPEEDRETFHDVAHDFVALTEPACTAEELLRAETALGRLRAYFEELVARRRAAPQDDLTSALVTVHDTDGDRLDGEELIQTLVMVFIAGFETTVNLLGNGIVALLEHPEAAAELRQDPALAEAVVDEVLRYDTPVQYVGRRAVRDTRIADVPVPKGAAVIAVLGAANRDPARFPDPDRFDIHRTGTRPASFGSGIHYCIGAALGRMEAEIVFSALLTRFPRLAAAKPPVRSAAINMNGFYEIPVTLN